MNRSDLPIEAASINGKYIEDAIAGYMTIKTKGREALTLEVEPETVGSAAGELIKSVRYPARTIEVEFFIQATSMEDLRSKLNHLNNILSADEADFVFNDEADKFYTGVPFLQSDSTDYKNGVKGKYNIYCAYPFKRSVEIKTAAPSIYDNSSAQVVINYDGTYPARPLLQAEFAGALSGGNYSDDGDCGFVAFIDNDENIIQIGNPDAIDIDAFSQAEQLINREFTTSADFQTSEGTTYDGEVVTGSVTANQDISDPYWKNGTGQTLKFIKPIYGTNANYWHGPILWQQPRALGAVDWNLSLVHRICCNATGQCGSFEIGAYNVNGNTLKMVAGILIIKDASGSNGTVKYIIDGKIVKTVSIDLSYYNTHFGYCNRAAVYQTQYYNKKKKKWQTSKIKGAKTRSVRTGYRYTQSNLNTSITKSKNSVTFRVGNLAAFTYTDNNIENLVAHNVSMHFGQMKGVAALHTNAVNSIRFTMNPVGTFADIPNVFTSGDIVEADCNSASVWLKHANTEDGQMAAQYGALGNDWEDFSLVKGINIINVVWSDWVNPNYHPIIKVLYNEVFL